jgi:hypothetical protein
VDSSAIGLRSNNTAIEFVTLEQNEGPSNTAVGAFAVQYNSAGDWNPAVGSSA